MSASHTAAMKAACKWLVERGADAAVVNVKGGGRIFLAQGEHAPFLPLTVKNLCEAGLAEFYAFGGKPRGRLRLTSAGRAVA